MRNYPLYFISICIEIYVPQYYRHKNKVGLGRLRTIFYDEKYLNFLSRYIFSDKLFLSLNG